MKRRWTLRIAGMVLGWLIAYVISGGSTLMVCVMGMGNPTVPEHVANTVFKVVVWMIPSFATICLIGSVWLSLKGHWEWGLPLLTIPFAANYVLILFLLSRG